MRSRSPTSRECKLNTSTSISSRTFLAVIAIAQIVLQTVAAQPSFSFRVVASGLSMPWEVIWGPDDQLWVTERTGRRVVQVNQTMGGMTAAVMIADGYGPGERWHERGLSLDVHPDAHKGAGRDCVGVV